MATGATCMTCRYHEHETKQCKRHAPILVHGSMVVMAWPLTEPGNWCGDHEAEVEIVSEEVRLFRELSAKYDAGYFADLSGGANIVNIADPLGAHSDERPKA